MIMKRNVESNSVSLRLRKPYTKADMSAHTVLTDDVFSYVDFYFKTHKRVIKDSMGKQVKQNYSFYWNQSRYFYNATKMLPIESAPLPMYYCMLNAVKSFLLYHSASYDSIKNDLSRHGLTENSSSDDYTLNEIKVCYKKSGIFPRFASMLDESFLHIWNSGADHALSIKQLLTHIPFVHAAYVSTYNVPRKNERFVPLKANDSPCFRFGSDKHIYLVADLDRGYFKNTATTIPEEIKKSLPSVVTVNPDEGFQLISTDYMRKNQIKNHYSELRKCFAYIKSDKRLWYLVRNLPVEAGGHSLNPMLVEYAIVHRFSEIVRYKPEQLVNILQGKENWLVHEFLSLVVDQFMDEIACEITRQEIMPTRVKE